MEGLLGFALMLALMVLFDGLALVSGVDSRDTATDQRNAVWPAVLGTH